MGKWLFHFLTQFRGPALYVGVFFILITCGLGVPLPEDAPLIFGGFFVAKSGSLALMIVTGLAGILIGDSIIFRAGATYGERLLETKLGKHIPGERVARVIGMFDKHGPKFIMLARFVPGLRAVTYFVAGTSGVPYWKFLTYDGLAACISAPLWILLGWWARQHGMLRKVQEWSFKAQMTLLGVFCGVLLLWLAFMLLRRRGKKKRAALVAASKVASEPAPPLRAVEGGRRP